MVLAWSPAECYFVFLLAIQARAVPPVHRPSSSSRLQRYLSRHMRRCGRLYIHSARKIDLVCLHVFRTCSDMTNARVVQPWQPQTRIQTRTAKFSRLTTCRASGLAVCVGVRTVSPVTLFSLTIFQLNLRYVGELITFFTKSQPQGKRRIPSASRSPSTAIGSSPHGVQAKKSSALAKAMTTLSRMGDGANDIARRRRCELAGFTFATGIQQVRGNA